MTIWGSHRCGYEHFCLLLYNVLYAVKPAEVSQQIFRLRFLGLKVSQARSRFCTLSTSCRFLVWLTIQAWRLRRHAPPKRRLTFHELHVLIYNVQNAAFPALFEQTENLITFKSVFSTTRRSVHTVALVLCSPVTATLSGTRDKFCCSYTTYK